MRTKSTDNSEKKTKQPQTHNDQDKVPCLFRIFIVYQKWHQIMRIHVGLSPKTTLHPVILQLIISTIYVENFPLAFLDEDKTNFGFFAQNRDNTGPVDF